uniref:Reverse transcriptase n=1 Tax=Oncorhynchus tshawytscha TaxID=74940 RepID=A0AAZ3SKM3_ONCTS
SFKMNNRPTVYRQTHFQEISKEEIQEAIKTYKKGKSPGPEFYKNCQDFIREPLLRVYTVSFARGELPPTFNHANMVLILKKNKPGEDCSSYRTVPLINVDSKISSKFLTRRLESLLPTLMKSDQTGL